MEELLENAIERYKEIMPELHYEQIPIKNLTAEQNYQRKLSVLHIKRAVENFNPYQINPVKVSRRNGINYVVNGQHTIEILATFFGSREIPVWCTIYDDLDYSKEADIFANQQKFVKPLTPYEIFMGNIEAGNDEQIMIKDIVEKYGLFLSPTKTQGAICAISTLETIFFKYGYQILDSTLRLCIATWEGEDNSLSSNMLKGIARILYAFGNELDEQIFKEKIGRYSVKEIARTASYRKAGSLGFAEAMIVNYNRKMKKPLDMSKLYKQKSHRKVYNDYQFDSFVEDELYENY